VAGTEIPDKPYFKIGEVAELAGVEAYVLRYWETEFKTIRPEKTRTNQRMYRRRDVEAVLQIKRLLYDEGYRIDGAKRRLRELSGEAPAVQVVALAEGLRKALTELDKIVDDKGKSIDITDEDKSTPTSIKLDPGNYTVTMSDTKGKSQTMNVTVEAGKPVKRKFDFGPVNFDELEKEVAKP